MSKILIVDDNTGDIELMRTAMCEVDPTVQVYGVASAVQALAFLTKENGFAAMPTPSLVLLDINMPGISGFQALRLVRDTPAWSEIQVVIWSSSCRGEDRDQAAALGAAEFVIKPSTWDQALALAWRLRSRLSPKDGCADPA
jgi:CheY-like chemotaxis protein